MANTPRTTTKTTSKFYQNMSVNGFNINFDFETENETLSSKIVANGAKGDRSMYASKEANNLQVIFSNGQYDAEVAAAVIVEFAAIEAEHSAVNPSGDQAANPATT